jgi:hypothetical protein
MQLSKGKTFEKPDAGVFLGTIIDVVDMPQVRSVYNGVVSLKDKIRVLWVLGAADGSNRQVLDKEGKPMTTVAFYNASTSERGNLMKAIRQIVNGQVPLLNNTEDVANLLLGRSNLLFLSKADNPQKPDDPYVNVTGIAPVPAGLVPPQKPAGFQRECEKPKTQAGPQGTPVQTYATPAAAAAAAQPQTQQQPQAQPQQPQTATFAPPQTTPTPNKPF